MGTYIINETYETIKRIHYMRRSLTDIFRDLQEDRVAEAERKLGDLAETCRDDFFAIDPVLKTLEHFAAVGGRQAAADTATAVAQRVISSKIGFHEKITALRDVFEGKAAPLPAPHTSAPGSTNADGFIERLRKLLPRF